jgi:hypothetical protein
MNRKTAEIIHSATNMTYWFENPNWFPGPNVVDSALKVFRLLPVSIHDIQKKVLFKNNVIAVSGESVVARQNNDTVHKYMFRYPNDVNLGYFRKEAESEIGLVTNYLSGIRLGKIDAVTQIQPYVSLQENPALTSTSELDELTLKAKDQAARDLEYLVKGTAALYDDYGFHPDIANSAGNLRINPNSGDITLIDVMPIYDNGSRLIGDTPANILEHAQQNARAYENYIGSYGR